MRRSLMLDRVVLLGRTLEEYQRFFQLDLPALNDQAVLDVAAGVSSFCAEACGLGLNVTAVDPIYQWPAEAIQARALPDLNHVVQAIAQTDVYRWDFYKSPEQMRNFRERSCRKFISHYGGAGRARYLAAALPFLPFQNCQFHLALVSYLLFVYERQIDCAFHKQSLLEIMRVADEARIYPIVTFAGIRSSWLDALVDDPELQQQLQFEIVQTDFEFLAGSNCYLRIRRKDTRQTGRTGIRSP